MQNVRTVDGAAQARRTRFGHLPDRIRYEDMVEEYSTATAAPEAYRPESAWGSFNCLVLDLGL